MVWPSSAAPSAARTHTGAAVTAEDLQQVQQGTWNTRNKAHKTHAVDDTDIMSSTSPQISEHLSKLKRTLTSIGSRNKISMPSSTRQTFIAPGALARGQGKKFHELYVTKSHNTISVGRVDNSKSHLMSSTVNEKSIDHSYIRHCSNGAHDHYGDGDPFNPMTNDPQDLTLIGSSDRGQHSPFPVHGEDVDYDGEDVDNIIASSLEEAVISSSKDEDLHIHRHAHILNHVLEVSATETPQAKGDNEMQTP